MFADVKIIKVIETVILPIFGALFTLSLIGRVVEWLCFS